MLRQHPNVVNIKGYYQDNEYYYVVQELCSGGELFDAIVSKASYSEREAQTVVRTLLYTIAYCHDRGIVHRDLKPENILLKNKQDYTNIKIADFGFAREVYNLLISNYLDTCNEWSFNFLRNSRLFSSRNYERSGLWSSCRYLGNWCDYLHSVESFFFS